MPWALIIIFVLLFFAWESRAMFPATKDGQMLVGWDAVIVKLHPLIQSQAILHAYPKPSETSRLLLAQATVETEYGHVFFDFNPWNVTVSPADETTPYRVRYDTDRYGATIQQRFRRYTSLAESAQNLFSPAWLFRSRYASANAALKAADSNYIRLLGEAGWYELNPDEYHTRLLRALLYVNQILSPENA